MTIGSLTIGSRFNGPPGTGNGGYSAGLFAAEFGGSGVEVTLRRPPPLETELVLRRDDTGLDVYDGDLLIAQARPAEVAADERVEPVDVALATEASQAYVGFRSHPFPTCFVCGPERAPGDGLRVFPGRLPDGRTAAPVVIPDGAGMALVWASLDCPGGWSAPLEDRPYVLGRIAARVDAVPAVGDTCVTVGQLVREEGRRAYVLTSLYSTEGELLATARATWVAVS